MLLKACDYYMHRRQKGVRDMEEKRRVCCNCGNNLRIKDESGMVVRCECAIDGHYIGYVECFEHWCRRWKKGRTWDDPKEAAE